MTDSAFVVASFIANPTSFFLIIPDKKEDANASPAPVVSTIFTWVSFPMYIMLLFNDFTITLLGKKGNIFYNFAIPAPSYTHLRRQIIDFIRFSL